MRVGVTGTPGTGKTIVAKKLSEVFRYEYLNFEDVVVRYKLYTAYDEDRDSYILDIGKARDKLASLIKDNMICEGLSIAYIASKEFFDKMIILRCNPYILEERLKLKGFSDAKVRENVASEILDLVAYEVYKNFGDENVIEIDNSKDLERTIEIAVKFLNGEDVAGDRVDWLSIIVEKNDIKRFLD